MRGLWFAIVRCLSYRKSKKKFLSQRCQSYHLCFGAPSSRWLLWPTLWLTLAPALAALQLLRGSIQILGGGLIGTSWPSQFSSPDNEPHVKATPYLGVVCSGSAGICVCVTGLLGHWRCLAAWRWPSSLSLWSSNFLVSRLLLHS